MKPSFKTLATIAAYGMSAYTIHFVLRLIPVVREWTCQLLPSETAYDDAYFGVWFGVLMAIVIGTIILMLKRGKQEPAMPDKQYRCMTYLTAILAVLGVVVGCCVTDITIYYTPVLYVPKVIRIPLLLSATAWLWLMPRQPGIGSISKALRVASIIGIVCLCVPILRMMISAVYYAFNGYVIIFRSWAVASWTQITIPAFLLMWYSIELSIYRRKNNTDAIVLKEKYRKN